MKKFSEYDRKGVADRLKQLRRGLGLTCIEASQKAGVSFSQLSKLEVKQGNLGMDSLVKLAEFYRVPKDWILSGGTVVPHPEEKANTGLKSHDHDPGLQADARLLKICQLACDSEIIAKAKIISETLGEPLANGLLVVIKSKINGGGYG